MQWWDMCKALGSVPSTKKSHELNDMLQGITEGGDEQAALIP